MSRKIEVVRRFSVDLDDWQVAADDWQYSSYDLLWSNGEVAATIWSTNIVWKYTVWNECGETIDSGVADSFEEAQNLVAKLLTTYTEKNDV